MASSAPLVTWSLDQRMSFEGFSYTYRKNSGDPVVALSEVTIDAVKEGDIVCVIGPNGAGKSTLIKRIAGVLRGAADEGIIRLSDGSAVVPGESVVRKQLYVPQTPIEGLVPSLDVMTNIAFRKLALTPVGLRRAIKQGLREEVEVFLGQHRVEWLVNRLGDSVESLSGGQQQVLNVLSVLFAEPVLLLLDEPTSRLDEVHRLLVWSLILSASKTPGCMVLCATHDHRMAYRTADRIVHLKDGRTVRSESGRYPRDKRFVGEIRLIKSRSDAISWSGVEDEWWRPTRGRLFYEGYFEGDDSIAGYLAGEKLDRTRRTLREVEGVIDLTGLEAHHLVLDVPCGWGRHSLELARRGYRVAGIDRNPAFVGRAYGEVTGAFDSPPVFCSGDMRAIALRAESVDRIINIWTSFGFFQDSSSDLRVLQEWYRVLKPGGKILVHTDHNPRRVSRGIFDEPPVRELWQGGQLEVYECYCEEDQRVYGKWTVTQDQGRIGPHGFSIRVYSEEEWYHLADQMGFKVDGIFGSLSRGRDPLSEQDQEFVVVLVKF